MKAIEILYEQIDDFNAHIKCANSLDEKFFYAELIGDVVNAIKNLGRYRKSNLMRTEDDYI